jgi:hypothetical protein
LDIILVRTVRFAFKLDLVIVIVGEAVTIEVIVLEANEAVVLEANEAVVLEDNEAVVLEANDSVVFEANDSVVFEANEAVVFEDRTHCGLLLFGGLLDCPRESRWTKQ